MAEHSYIRVRWLRWSPDDPVDLWSELDADRQEVRKVEIWRDGRVGYASKTEEVGGTRLGEFPVPPLNKVNRDPEFRGEAITKIDFETCWIDVIGRDRFKAPYS
jgi:hypothetical protein